MASKTLLERLRHSKEILYLPLSTKTASLQTLWRYHNTTTQAMGSKRS